MVRKLFLFALSLSLISQSLSQTGQDRTLEASYTEKRVKMDGVPKDSVWKVADRAKDFVQREMNVGEPATERTEVAIAYGDRNLYIFAWCYDKDPDGIIHKELRRDFNNGPEDDFQVILDTYNDDRNGYQFVTNPNGARLDYQVINNGDASNKNWDGVWDVATRITDQGWFAEIKIPFTTLKYPNSPKQEWGVNFQRNIRRKREQVRWTGWSRDMSFQQVNRAGTLTNLDKLRTKDFVELKPYGLAGLQDDGDEPSRLFDVGGDVNYSITPTIRARLTINTDFAQVEADRQQINLTRFPLRFPERREFFLEGQNYFNMGFGGNRVTPFYSRRIGLTRDREQIPILAGTRILGKQRNSTIGAMSIQTASKDSIPTTNYTVASWRENVGKQSTIGAMTVNKYAKGRWHTTTGVNGRYRTSKFLGDKNLNMRSTYVHTYDDDKNFDEKANAYRVEATYPNDQLFVFTSYQRSQAPFDPEVGLMRRRNFQEAFGMMNWEPRPDPDGWLGWIQQFKLSPGQITYTYFDDTKELQTFLYTIKPFGFKTRSGESMGFSISRNGEGVRRPFSIENELRVDSGEYWTTRYNLNASSFSGRTFSGSVSVDWGDFFDGSSVQSNYSLSWRTSRFLTIGVNYERNQIRMSNERLRTNLFGTRLDYAITPDLFGSLFAQWNNQDELGIMNYRLQWIPKVGTRFFLIVNQRYNTKNDVIHTTRTSVIGKLVWRFVI